MFKFFILIILAMTLVACGDSADPAPKSLTGTWKSGDPELVAHISEDSIKIDIELDGSSHGLYWKGSFPSTAEDGDTLTSVADTEALDASIFGSGSDTKEFSYEDGKLVFSFSMFGITQDVSLER